MEKSVAELTLGTRLATRYVPNQILSSVLSWGYLIGVDEVWKLEKRFLERSIMHGEDGPALTKAWFVHYIMEILKERINTLTNSVTLENVMQSDVHLMSDDDIHEYREEVEQWVSSFAIQLAAHDPLRELCDASNEELENIIHHSNSSSIIDVDGERKRQKSYTGRSLKLTSTQKNQFGRTSQSNIHRKKLNSQEIVRWSDLLTNLVRDYEHFHRVDEDGLFFTRVQGKQVSGRTSPLRSLPGKDSDERNWSKMTSNMKDIEHDGNIGNEMHVQSADCILVSPLTGYIITSSRDGIVKLWNGDTGLFQRNLYNAGSSWVIGMFLLQDEDYIIIVTTNSQLTVLDFPEGNVIQKYLGCSSIRTAFYDVVQLSATNIQRYGMKPGECGTYRVELKKGETAEHYHRRRREAQNEVLSRILPAKPMVGFTAPTSCCFDTYTGIFFFGSASGTVGAFDIASDVRPGSLMSGANCKPVWPLFLTEVHLGCVVGIFYTSYATSLFSAGADGCIYRTPLKPTGKPAGESRLVGHQSKPIRMMQWWPPSKYYVTIHVDRRVALWVIGRYGDPLHHFPSETQEVVSAALHPRQQRLALLLSDKTIKVYETHGNKSIATIAQPPPESIFNAADPSQQMMEQSVSDEDGVVAWHPYHSYLICCLRSTVIYAPTKSSIPGLDDASLLLSPKEEKSVSKSGEIVGGDVNISALCGIETSGTPVESRRLDTHRSGVVAMVVQRQLCDLHTFDEDSWRVWDLQTGTMKQHTDVSRAARMESIPLKHLRIASCSWTTSLQRRLVTGSEDCSFVTWDPTTATPLAVEMFVQDAADKLDSDVFVLSHRNRLIVWSARICRVITFNSGVILPNGVEESTFIAFRVPSLASLTACCVVRDTYLCFGTGDAKIFFYSIWGGAPTHECVLREKSEEEKGSVVQLIFLNEQNQNLLLVFLDIGTLFVYSYINQNVVYRMRLVRRFECRIRKVLYVSEDGIAVYGDSTGRVRAIDVRGCTSVSMEFRNAFIQKFAFQGASDEITSLEFFRTAGRRYLVVGSLDCHVRLFQLDDVGWSQTVSSFTGSLHNAPVTVTYVGIFGRDTWDLSDATTFSDQQPVARCVVAANIAEEELLLENIINPDVAPESLRSITDLLSDDDNSSRVRSRWHSKNTLSSPTLVSPRKMSGRPFFLTDVGSAHDEGSFPSIFLSSIDTCKPLHQQQQHQQQQGTSSPPLSSPVITASVGSRASEHQASLFTGTGRRTQVRMCAPEVPINLSSGIPSVEQTMQSQGQEQMTGSQRGSVSTGQRSFSETTRVQTKALWTMARRIEGVMSREFANGELIRKANELRLIDKEWALRQNKSLQPRPESGGLELALKTRRELAKRMEEYKRRQELRRREKKDSPPLVSARHHLAPVVIPQPSIIKDNTKPSHIWIPNTSRVQRPSIQLDKTM